ncbi:hypothetical protein [Endozoicomonas sp. ISHI1]|uniref:hypothetical protein n=1 Tax=Endozoicomonas sp. ISHI1 TaxID=2825882 RepID=UPI00214794BC|nr:hypothetical protein [Endozoicomonas sp. ISHI1]
MKNSSSVALLSLLLSMSAIGQAESWTRHYVVELGQDGSSPMGIFSIRSGQHTFPDTPSHLVDTNAYTEAILPSEDKPHRLGSYGVKTSFIKSVSWQLIYATSVLVAYDLAMTTDDAAPGAKPYSWIPVEAFFAVGWLSGSYWNTDSPLFIPIDKPEAGQDDPFAINTMMLPANGQQQRQQREERTESSIQQASGASTFTGALTGPLSSGSGDGNDGPEQHQHTLGLDCRVSPCKGICIFRPASSRIELAEGWLNSMDSTAVGGGAEPEQSSFHDVPDRYYSAWDYCDAVIHFDLDNAFDNVIGNQRDHYFYVTGRFDNNPTNRQRPIDSMSVGAASTAEEPIRDETVTRDDRQHQPCGKVFRSDKALQGQLREYNNRQRRLRKFIMDDMAKNKGHSYLKVCEDKVLWRDGQRRKCGAVFDNAQCLLDHKRSNHKPQICDETVAGGNNQQPCGIVCEDFEELIHHKQFDHRGKHLKHKPVDLEQGNDLGFPKDKQ